MNFLPERPGISVRSDEIDGTGRRAHNLLEVRVKEELGSGTEGRRTRRTED